tara:strand:+ start:3440 stop:4312 length:873 start_codon:yes stop_codon:yes gene_type:complete
MDNQTDNLQVSPGDVESAVTGPSDSSVNDAGDFFTALDSQVNGLIADNSPSRTSTVTSKDLKNQNATANVNEPVDELETLQKRYSDSSREAKRLNTRVRELEEYAPLLDRMREDPQLISTVRNYIEGTGKQGIKEQLGVSEDFVFDPDEAFSDPKSESAKVFDSVVNQKVKKVVDATNNKQTQKQKLANDVSEFRQKHDMSDDSFKEFMDFATSRPLSYDDIYFLMNRDSRDQNIATETRKEIATQMANVRQSPKSLASSGATSKNQNESNVEDAIFDTMLKEGLDNLFQ